MAAADARFFGDKFLAMDSTLEAETSVSNLTRYILFIGDDKKNTLFGVTFSFNDRKTEHFKALLKHHHSSAIADHVKTTGHNIKWDHFDILASGKTDYHCKIKETLFIQELQPALNANVSSEKLLLY